MAGGAPLPVREYASVEDMRRHAAEVRGRLFAPRKLTLELPRQAPAAKAWAKPEVEQIGFIAPKPVRPEDYEKRAFEALRRLTRIVSDTSEHTRIAIISQRQAVELVKARQIIFWLARRYTLLSLPQIGRQIGGRHHATVLHGVRRVQEAIDHRGVQFVDCEAVMASRLWEAFLAGRW